MTAQDNIAGKVDEQDLVEESQGNEAGGTWTITIRVSLAVCPTSGCTRRC